MSGGVFGSHDEDEAIFADINVTPLVDVVLVLLVIFMITAPMLGLTLEVELPEVTTAKPATKSSIVITVGEEGTIAIEDRIVSLEDAAARAKAAAASGEGSVFLRGDAGVTYGYVVSVLDRLRQEGVENVELVVQPIAAPADSDTPRPAPRGRRSR